MRITKKDAQVYINRMSEDRKADFDEWVSKQVGRIYYEKEIYGCFEVIAKAPKRVYPKGLPSEYKDYNVFSIEFVMGFMQD